MAEHRYYVTCSCGWHNYRKSRGPGSAELAAQVVGAKPCPQCGGEVEVRHRMQEGKRGPKPGPIKHGTRQGYARGCTCKRCRDAEREYQRDRYRERQKEAASG